MRFFRAALGVPCQHCHVIDRDVQTTSEGGGRIQPGWWYEEAKHEIDTPNKQMARLMIRMTAAINKDAFGGRTQVTCFTCHRGSTRPASSYDSNLIAVSTVTPADPKAVSGVSADEILAKFIAALGGQAAVRKISSRVAKGTVLYAALGAEGPRAEGQRAPEAREGARPARAPLALEIYAKAPDFRAVAIHEGDGVIRSFRGDTGWYQLQDSVDVRHQARDMRGDELDNARLDDPFFFAAQLTQLVHNLRVTRVEKVGGKEAYVVVGSSQSLPEVQYYFDKESGMLVRAVQFTQTFVGRYPTTIDFSDFRTVDGVQMPFRWVSEDVADRQTYIYKLDNVQQNIPVDESQFAKPDKYLYWFKTAAR